MNANLPIKEVINSGRDLYADEIMSKSEEPSYEDVSSFLPQANSWDFIGTDQSKWKFLIGNDGRLVIETTVKGAASTNYRQEVYCAFDPANEALPYAGQKGRQSLLDNWLPVNITSFPGNWKQTSFASTDKDGKTFLYIKASNESEAVFLKAKEPESRDLDAVIKMDYAPPKRLPDESEFNSKLAKLKSHWDKVFSDTMQVELPDANLLNGAKNAIIKSFHSCVGNATHYGVTRYFCDTERNAESFAPTTTTMVDTCLEWGLFEKAKQVLTYFLDNFVSNNGELIHRGNGASVSEHGMMLETISRYYNYTGDDAFVVKHSTAIISICNHLLNERKKGKEEPRDSKSHGLTKGCAEDDTRAWEAKPWYSGNCWSCRGLEEAAKMLAKTGQSHFAEEILTECESFKNDILNSMKASVIADFLPPYAGFDKPFKDLSEKLNFDEKSPLYFTGYSNYRFYPEMLSAGIMTDDLAKKLMDYRSSHGGEFLGLTKMICGEGLLLDDWPLYNQMRGLIEADCPKKFQMTLYAHMAHHQARGTFFAPESTHFDKLDSIHCVPSQLTVPQALKWMLAYSERDKETLRLCKAVPARWLKSKNGIKVSNAPTRWGKISFSIVANGKDLTIKIKLSKRTFPEKISCRIPNAANLCISSSSLPADCLKLEGGQLLIEPKGKEQFEINLKNK